MSTVKFHVASLMTKLGARNRVELAMWAYNKTRQLDAGSLPNCRARCSRSERIRKS